MPLYAPKSQAPITILFPDGRAEHQDIASFEAIERAAWETCDAIFVSRVPIDSKIVPHLHRTRIVVRAGVGFDTVDLEA